MCRKLAPDHAHIFGVVPHLGIGALPAGETSARLRPGAALPGLRPYPHVVAAGIGALNPVVHPPGVLMNAGRIERSHGDFYFYEEGVTPAVVRAIEALDRERQAIGAALGFAVTPVAEGFAGAGFGPAGDLWATINGSRMLTAMRAPGAIATRWLSEDVPYGLRTWVELGERFGVALPVARALVTLADAVLGTDSWRDGRSLADLGSRASTARGSTTTCALAPRRQKPDGALFGVESQPVAMLLTVSITGARGPSFFRRDRMTASTTLLPTYETPRRHEAGPGRRPSPHAEPGSRAPRTRGASGRRGALQHELPLGGIEERVLLDQQLACREPASHPSTEDGPKSRSTEW